MFKCTAVKRRNNRQMVRRHARVFADMDLYLFQGAAWFHPDTVESEQRPAGGKSCESGRGLKMPMHPAQRPSSKEPFIDVSHQYGRISAILFDDLEQSAYLIAPFGRTQSQMRGNGAKRVTSMPE